MTEFFRLKSVDCNPDKILSNRGLDAGGKVQQFIDSECLRLANIFAPFDQHTLIASGNTHTKIGSGQIEYRTPYARRLYYHPEYNFSKEHNPQAGGLWFERMKQQYKEQIQKGAAKIAGK